MLALLMLAVEVPAEGESPTHWENVALICGIVVALMTAIVALYRARPQRALDQATKEKIDEEVKRLQSAHDHRRTIRLLRLERYIDRDIQYHREIAELLEVAQEEGLLPQHVRIPSPPELPPYDEDD
ncbi:hypothetical protein ACEWX3_07545 [Mycobacterium sp. G7A2]|uniref:hypothetical protein n=1 Tax=Mycobacterium sp. G7A2 TaxID=3317307 RepID=UPI0035A90C41